MAKILRESERERERESIHVCVVENVCVEGAGQVGQEVQSPHRDAGHL